MPPLGQFKTGNGFIPDLSVLLMFDEFIIDAQAHDRIVNGATSSWLGQWPDVLGVLGSEGALSVVDVKEEVKKVALVRGTMLKKDMQNPAKWADAMMYYDTLMADLLLY